MMSVPRAWGLCCALVAAVLLVLTPMPVVGQGIAVTVTLEQPTVKTVIAPAGQSGAPGVTIVYDFLLRNTTTAATSFSLALTTSPRWKASLLVSKAGKVGPLSPGQVITVPVAVTIPKNAVVGSTGSTTLAATSADKPRVSGQDTVTTTAVPSSGLILTMDDQQLARPGASVRYRATVTNGSDWAHRVTIWGRSLQDWPVTATAGSVTTVTIPAGQSVEVMFEVAVPVSAASTFEDALVVTVEVQGPESARLQAVGVTTIQ